MRWWRSARTHEVHCKSTVWLQQQLINFNCNGIIGFNFIVNLLSWQNWERIKKIIYNGCLTVPTIMAHCVDENKFLKCNSNNKSTWRLNSVKIWLIHWTWWSSQKFLYHNQRFYQISFIRLNDKMKTKLAALNVLTFITNNFWLQNKYAKNIENKICEKQTSRRLSFMTATASLLTVLCRC